jgi:hypothetical protein
MKPKRVWLHELRKAKMFEFKSSHLAASNCKKSEIIFVGVKPSIVGTLSPPSFIVQVPIVRKLCSDVCPAAERVKGKAQSESFGKKPDSNPQKPNGVWWHQPRNANMSTLSKHSGNLSLFQGELVAYNSKNSAIVYNKTIGKQIEKYLKKRFGLYFKFVRTSRLTTDDQWYRRSGLYNGNGTLDLDRRYFEINARKIQGLELLMYSATSAAGYIGSAVGYYYMYHMFKDAKLSLKSLFGETNGIAEFIKRHIMDIITALALFAAWYDGRISASWAMLGVGGLFVYNTHLKQIVLDALSQLMPAESTFRHTQGTGQNVTTLAQSLIGIVMAIVLGTGCTQFSFSHLLTSVKTLGSALLTVKTTEAVLVAIVNNLPDIIRYGLSIRFPALALYVAVTSNEEFRNFIKESIELQSITKIDLFYNSHNMALFLKNYNYLKYQFINTENQVNGSLSIIANHIEWYDQVYAEANDLGLLPTKRKLPYVLWISGDPGVGKSMMVKGVAKQLLEQIFDKETVENHFDKLVYSFNTSLKYMDGYNNQPIFILNDYLQFAQENEEQWLIRFADTIDCPLEVSSVDNISSGIKGEVRFTSRIIIVTSNTTYLNASQNVTNVTAFNRRRDMLVDITFKPEGAVDTQNPDYSWARIRQLPSIHNLQARNNIYEFPNVEALFSTIRKNVKDFNVKGMPLHARVNKDVLKGRALCFQSQENEIERILKDVWTKVVTFMDVKIMGVKIGLILPMLLAGSAAYVLYKAWVPALISKITQSASGDMTTKKLKKAMVPLNRTTLGYSQDINQKATTISNNMVKITTIIHVPGSDNAMATGIRQQMWGWSCGGSLIITPKHLWRRGTHTVHKDDIVIIERSGVEHKIPFNDDMLVLSEDRDLACFNTMSFLLPFKTQLGLMVKESAHVNQAGEPCCIIVPQAKGLVSLIENEAYITDAPYVDPMGHRYEGLQIWQYNQKFNQGDCGSIMVLTRPALGGVIAGMHVAGDNFSGNAEVLTQDFVEQCKEHFGKVTQGFCTNAEYDDEEFFDAESDLEGNFYYLGATKNAPYQNTKTEIVKGPLYEVLQPHLTEPAVLSPSDVRMEQVCSPMLKSVSKYGVPAVPFDSALMDKAFNIVKEFYNPIKFYKLKAFEINDAVNAKWTPNLEKLDLSTSAGYPWAQKGKRKSDLISKNEDGEMTVLPELRNVLNTCENLLAKKTMFAYTLTTTLKDERVAIDKVKIGKTRTFMNFPVEYTVLMRRYFDDFIDKETKHALDIGTTVGVNIYSTQWDIMYKDLVRFNYSLDGDFKAFDGTIRPEFFRLYAKLVNSFYKDEFDNVRRLLVTGCCFAPIFVLNKVYVKLQGNPSGSRITTSFNSFVNRMYVVMSMLSNLPEHLQSVDYLLTNMKIFAHGDDHLIGFNQGIRDYWDGIKLRDFMLSHGIDYTSSVKDQPLVPTRYLHECFYLKSHFVYNMETHRWQAGLSKEVIQEMVSWQRDTDLNSTKMIVNTALRYAYFWGRDYFSDIYEKLNDAISARRLNIRLVDYESLNSEYNYNGGQLTFDFVN